MKNNGFYALPKKMSFSGTGEIVFIALIGNAWICLTRTTTEYMKVLGNVDYHGRIAAGLIIL